MIILKNTTLLTIKSAIVLLIDFYASRVLLQKIGVEDYGVYHLVNSVVLMFLSLRMFFANAIQRYLNYTMGQGDVERLGQVFNTGIQVQLLLAVVFVLILETVGLFCLLRLNLTSEQMQVAKVLFQLAIATAVVSMLTVPYDALLLAHERMDIYSLLAVVEKILALAVIFMIEKGPFDHLINYSLMLFCVSCLIRSLNAVFCRRHFFETRIVWRLHKPLMREMGAFAGWNFLGWTGYSLMHEGINYMLNIAGGVVVNAGRSIAYQIMNGCTTISNNVNTAFRPQTNAAAASTDHCEFHRLIYKSARASFLLNLVVTVPLLALARPVIQLWLGQVPQHVVPFALTIGGYNYLRSLHPAVNDFFLSIGKLKLYQIIEVTVLLFNLPFAWFLLCAGYPYWTVLASLSLFEMINHICSIWLATVKYNFPLRQFLRKVYLPFIIVGTAAYLILKMIYAVFY